ncbi:MAG: monooxygenase [Dehalococcoidia bacterium]|nr:MAG: monooxygenase [Dehalococcoidia bacterium]
MTRRSPLQTAVCDRLGIRYPIVLAAMGSTSRGVPTPPRLVAAVSEAGGLGMLGSAGQEPEEIRRRIAAVRRLTDRPFGVGLLLPVSRADAVSDRAAMRALLRERYPQHVAFVDDLRQRWGLPDVEASGPVLTPDLVEAQLDVVFAEHVPVLAIGLGDVRPVIERRGAVDVTVIGLVGTPRQAQALAAAGVDIIVGQGYEAGGHTGRIATFPLIPQIVDAVAPRPVLAAGGIADGRGLAAALALGAAGVWCGTAFLVAEESEIYPEQQQAILAACSDEFVVTRAYTGKTARDVKNDVIAAWEASGLEPLPMPLQWILMDDFVAAAEAAGRIELINNPAGQAGGLLRSRRPAADIVQSMVEEAQAILRRLCG